METVKWHARIGALSYQRMKALGPSAADLQVIGRGVMLVFIAAAGAVSIAGILGLAIRVFQFAIG